MKNCWTHDNTFQLLNKRYEKIVARASFKKVMTLRVLENNFILIIFPFVYVNHVSLYQFHCDIHSKFKFFDF